MTKVVLVALLSTLSGCARFQSMSPGSAMDETRGVWVARSYSFLGLASSQVVLYCRAVDPAKPVCVEAVERETDDSDASPPAAEAPRTKHHHAKRDVPDEPPPSDDGGDQGGSASPSSSD